MHSTMKREESGYNDPLGSSKDFDLLDYMNDENSNINTPMDSPAEFGHMHQQHNHMAHHPQHQQQQQQQQHQLLLGNINVNSSGSYGGGYVNAPIHLDNGLLYGSGMRANMAGAPPAGIIDRNRQSRLPDSPPITDISVGAMSSLSSASPSSGGSASGDSPYSPTSIGGDPYGRGYHHQNSMPLNGNILLSMQAYGNTDGMQQNGGLPAQMLAHQAGRGLMMAGQSGGGGAQKLSPQSEFLSPYPPCQSTPGSQHSSASSSGGPVQISPPNYSPNVEGGIGNGYLLQQINPPQRYVAASETVGPMVKGEIQQTPNGGYKRRRTSTTNGTPGQMAPGQQPSQPVQSTGSQNVPLMHNVKSEGLFAAGGSTNNNNNNSNENGRANLAGYAATQIFASTEHHSRGSRGNGSQGNCSSGSSSGTSSINGDVSCNGMGNGSMGGQHAPPLSNHSTDYDFDDTGSIKGGSQRSIKFSPFFKENWLQLYDSCSRPVDPLTVHIVADKGFNYFAAENCFVNQKKNHFQITVHISRIGGEPPYWLQTPASGLQQIAQYRLQFCGVKSEMPTSEVAINQSQSDRKPVALDGVELKMNPTTITKQTVPRLHFSQTTMNNHRKNGKSNPEQKFFLLVAKIVACTPAGEFVVQAYQSERVIVRASNPGQFEQPEGGVGWQPSANEELLHFGGQVAIGTDKALDANAKLSVLGNVFTTGQVTRPSDRRVKEDIAEMDTSEAMSRISQMRIVEYNYKKEIAEKWGIEQNRHRVGVIAQELERVLPDAVKDSGEFLTVDDTRIFYDTVAAAQELYRLTGNLGCKIDQVEKISQKLARYAQRRRQLGSMASGISDFSGVFGTGPTGALGGGGDGDNRAFLSQSRVSLTSAPAAPYTVGDDTDGAAKKPKARKSKRHANEANSGGGYRRCRSVSSASSYSYCHRGRVPDNALCSSKVTQGTIVTLVVIMALCLMAMCTLYVMDWYNRTYIYAPSFHHYSSPTHSHHHHFANPNDSNNYKPNVVGPSSSSDDHGIIDPGFYAEPHESEKLWNDLTQMALTMAAGGAPLVGGYCSRMRARTHCPVFCCAAPPELISLGVPVLDDEAVDGNGNMEPPKLPAPLPLELRANSILHARKNEANNDRNDDTVGGTLESGVRIEVLNLDAALDAGYCTPHNGCDARAGRYNLLVPVSPYLPTIPLRLKFHIAEGLFVDNCVKLHNFNDQVCHDFGEASAISRRLSDTVFEVPAGGFLQSAYSFRVGHTTESCRMSSVQMGRAFDEYNIAFFRLCDGVNNTSADTSKAGAAAPTIRVHPTKHHRQIIERQAIRG